jgi:hypothetical protein
MSIPLIPQGSPGADDQFAQTQQPYTTPSPGSFGSLGAITGMTGGAPFPIPFAPGDTLLPPGTIASLKM